MATVQNTNTHKMEGAEVRTMTSIKLLEPNRVLSPVRSSSRALPPIALEADVDGGSHYLLEQSKTEVEESMKHLLTEVLRLGD